MTRSFANRTPTLDYDAYESITVTGTAGGLTTATVGPALAALITVEDAQVRFRLDGTVPTSSVGHILDVGATLELDSGLQLANVNFIRTGGTSAILRCAYGS